MANMSYCRFRNTLGDLQACDEALSNAGGRDGGLSEEEARSALALIRLCGHIAEYYGELELPDILEKEDEDEDEEEKTCSICGSDYEGYGHNAEPVNEGRCCEACNDTKVIPARLNRVNSLKK